MHLAVHTSCLHMEEITSKVVPGLRVNDFVSSKSFAVPLPTQALQIILGVKEFERQ